MDTRTTGDNPLENREDNLENPKPQAGTTKKTVDAVLGLIKTGNGVVSLLSGLLAAVLILYSGYVLYDSFATEYRAQSSAWDLLRYKPEIIDENPTPLYGGEKLESVNQDYRAWLTMYETTIDYPVVQGANDLYYASHDIYGQSSLTGAIYLAAANSRNWSDSYNLVYGHHMDNGAMFGSLDNYKSESYIESHRKGVLVAGRSVYDLTVFAVASTDAYESQIYTVGSRAQAVKDFLTGDLSGAVGVGTSVHFYDADVAADAVKVLALSTCASADTNGRLVVFCRMTRREVGKGTLTVR